MKLKQRTKRELIRRTEGVISLLLVLLLVPFYSVAAILMEVGRFQNAYRGLDDAIGSSEVSVLAQYDKYIKERFGLLAVSQDIDSSTRISRNRIHRIHALFRYGTAELQRKAYTRWRIPKRFVSKSWSFRLIPSRQN